MRSKTTDRVIVIGNGESRTNINIQQLVKNNFTVACNAFHRDHSPDVLICCDRDTAYEALKNTKIPNTKIVVREDFYLNNKDRFHNRYLEIVPSLPAVSEHRQDQPEHWGSGTYAALYAARQNPKEIYLIGFDLYGRKGLVNNIYKGTEHYSPATAQSVDPSYWIYQLSVVFKYNLPKRFFIVNDKNWVFPEPWKLSNVEFIETDYFNKHLAH